MAQIGGTQSTSTLSEYLAAPATSNVFFSYAQISDTHIDVSDSVSINALKSVVDEINENEAIAFVVLTGDITEYGDRGALNLTKNILSRLRCPYYVLPGNHDTKWSASAGDDFKKVFGDDKFRLLFNGYLFIGLNNAPTLRQTNGHVQPNDIQWVEKQLKNVGRKTPIFLMTHYPLKNGDVDNWFELTDKTRKYNIQAIVCGHYHCNMMADFDGIPGMMLRPLIDKDNNVGYSIHEFVDDTVFVYEKVIEQHPSRWNSIVVQPKTYVEGDPTKYPRQNYSVNNSYRSIKKRWSRNYGYEINATPAVDDLYAYFGDNHGTMHAVQLKNGKEVWSYNTFGRIISSAQIYDDKLVFSSTDQRIYCLNKLTGKLLWRVQTNAAVVADPLILQGVVYCGSADGCLRAINVASGDVLWINSDIDGFMRSKPIAYNGMIIAPSSDNNIYALRASDGVLAWKCALGNNQTEVVLCGAKGTVQSFTAPIASPPVLANGKIYATTYNGKIYAIDAMSGLILWSDDNNNVIESNGLTPDLNTFLCRTADGTLLSVDTQSASCKIINTTGALYPADNNHSKIVVSGHVAYISTNTGEVIAVDIQNYKLLWIHKVSLSALNDVVVLDDSRILVTSTDGSMTLIAK